MLSGLRLPTWEFTRWGLIPVPGPISCLSTLILGWQQRKAIEGDHQREACSIGLAPWMSHFTLGTTIFFLHLSYFLFFLSFPVIVLKQAQVAQAVLEFIVHLEILPLCSSCFYLPNTGVAGVLRACFSHCWERNLWHVRARQSRTKWTSRGYH